MPNKSVKLVLMSFNLENRFQFVLSLLDFDRDDFLYFKNTYPKFYII